MPKLFGNLSSGKENSLNNFSEYQRLDKWVSKWERNLELLWGLSNIHMRRLNLFVLQFPPPPPPSFFPSQFACKLCKVENVFFNEVFLCLLSLLLLFFSVHTQLIGGKMSWAELSWRVAQGYAAALQLAAVRLDSKGVLGWGEATFGHIAPRWTASGSSRVRVEFADLWVYFTSGSRG